MCRKTHTIIMVRVYPQKLRRKICDWDFLHFYVSVTVKHHKNKVKKVGIILSKEVFPKVFSESEFWTFLEMSRNRNPQKMLNFSCRKNHCEHNRAKKVCASKTVCYQQFFKRGSTSSVVGIFHVSSKWYIKIPKNPQPLINQIIISNSFFGVYTPNLWLRIQNDTYFCPLVPTKPLP